MTGQQDITAIIHPLYAVPLLQSTIPNPQELNRSLSDLFIRLQNEGDRHKNQNRFDTQFGVFESNFQLHDRNEQCVRTLFDSITRTMLSFIQGINQYNDEQMSRLILNMHSWFHITKNGGFQSSHNHPNASWSLIYCVDPGDNDNPESGAVRFHDPRIGSDMFKDPANDNLQVPYKICPWQLKHKPGQLLAFPSYLVHEVFPYLGHRPRIIVAANTWCTWRQH